VAPHYRGTNLKNLTVQAYSRHNGVDTAVGAAAAVAADGSFNVNLSTNAGGATDNIVFKVFDGATQIGLDTVLAN